MDNALIEQLKRTPMSPAALKLSKGGLPDAAPFIHPDFPGHVFKSRAALKKAFSVQRYNANTLRKQNANRLRAALEDILFKNGVNIPKMAQGIIERRLNTTSMLTNEDVLRSVVREVIRREIEAVFNPSNVRNREAAWQTYIAGIAKEEAKRLVLENMDFDMTLSGRAFVNKSGRRAVKLGAEEHERAD